MRTQHAFLNWSLRVSAVLTILISVPSLRAADLPEGVMKVEALLQNKAYTDAAKAAAEHAKSGKEALDYAAYLEGLALFRDAKHADAERRLEQFEKRHPKSVWLRKARFLRARAAIEQKKHEAAEAILEEEAFRLLAGTRKQRIANVLIKFADELARLPEPDDPAGLKPDHARASQFYLHALKLELDRPTRDWVEFAAARSFQKQNNHAEAEKRWLAYLNEFDPTWAGPVGSPARNRGHVKVNPPPAGQFRYEGRYRIAESQIAMQKLRIARQNLEDLLSLIEKEKPKDEDGKIAKLVRDAKWEHVKTFRLPNPEHRERDLAIVKARAFMAAYPDDKRSAALAHQIALALGTAGQTDEAIEAYRDFVAERNFRFPRTEETRTPDAKTGVSPVDEFKRKQMQAAFTIGQLLSGQKKYEDAIGEWRQYIARYPNGPQWAQCQSSIIDTEFRIGLEAIASGESGAAREHFDAFLAKYPLDARARQILFIIGQIHYEDAVKLEKDEDAGKDKIAAAYRKAAAQWERLASKYPNTEEASVALYRAGVVQEEKLQDWDNALATFRRLNWGSKASPSVARITLMTKKSLQAKTDRVFRTNEVPFIRVNARNVEKLTLKRYSLDLEAYFRKRHSLTGFDKLDIDLIEPDKVWEVPVEGYKKYAPAEMKIEVPFEADQPGVCVVKVTDSENTWEATTLVLRSDIDVIVKSSRKEALVFVQDRLKEGPAAKATVLLTDGTKVIATGETGEDGVYRGKVAELKDLKNLSVLAIHPQGMAVDRLSIEGLEFGKGLAPKGYIYTSKPAYRPGEPVAIKGIVRVVTDGSYAVPDDRDYTVRVTDSQGRLIKQSSVTLSEFGTCNASADLPDGAALGNYNVSLVRKDGNLSFSGGFQVQKFTLDTIELDLAFARPVVFRGEPVELTVKAAYYWGTPVEGRMIRYTLPDGRTYSERTDKKGELAIRLDTSGFQPGQVLAFRVELEGTKIVATGSVHLANLGFTISAKPAQKVALAGEPVDIQVETKGADGKPVGKELTLLVKRAEPVKPNPVLANTPWVSSVMSQPAVSTTVDEKQVKTDPKTGKATVTLRLEKGGGYTFHFSGVDRFEQPVSGTTAMTISGDEDATKLRLFVKKSTWEVGATAPLRLHSRLDPALALVTYDGDDILGYKVVKIGKGYNEMPLRLEHKHFPNFKVEVAALDGDKLRTASKELTVERALVLTVKPAAPVVAPGGKGVFEITATDQNGKPVSAEFSLALVNEALFALYPDARAPVHDFFHKGQTRRGFFRIGSTAGFSYAGHSRRVLQEVKDEKERLARQDREERDLQQAREVVAANQVAFGYFANGNVDGSQIMLNGGARGGPDGQFRIQMRSPQPATDRSVPMPQLQSAPREDNGKKDADKAARPGGTPRKDVDAASRWVASVLTDDVGKATVRISLPANTAKWRVTSIGGTRDTLVGETKVELITRKDFFAELKAPPIVQEGDSLNVVARVHNLTKKQGEARVTLRVRSRTGEVAERKTFIEVRRNSVAEVVFDPFDIPVAEALEFAVEVEMAELTDAVARTIPVRPWGMEYADHAGGVSRGDAAVFLKLPKREYTSKRMIVSVSPSLQRAIIDMAMQDFPNVLPVCGEWRACGRILMPPPPPRSDDTGLLAAVSALTYARQHGANAEDIRRLVERVKTLAASLVVTQDKNGNWRNWHETTRAYWALALVRKAGVATHADSLNKAETALKNLFKSLGASDDEAKAAVLHALSVNGKADFANLNRIYRNRNSLSSLTLAYLANGYANLGRPEIANELLGLLEAKAVKDKTGKPTHWTAATKRQFFRDPVETTALTLLAYARLKPDSPMGKVAAGFLLKRKGHRGYRSQRALGPAVNALTAWFGTAKDVREDYQLRVLVNDREVWKLDSRKSAGAQVFIVPNQALKPEDNSVRFEMKGRGEFAYGATLTGFSPEIKDPHSWDNPYIRSRGYYHTGQSYRNVKLKSASSTQVKNLEFGQRVQIRTSLYHRTNENIRWEEFLPGGTELVKGSLRGDFLRVQYEDRKIVMWLKPGTYNHSVTYELVASIPGKYRVLPGVLVDTIDPGRMRIGPTAELTVLKPGEKSPDTYLLNRHEHFELATLKFNDRLYDQAQEHLDYLFAKYRKNYEKDLARMLLWIHCSREKIDAKRIVEMFEILRERHPTLVIPFDKILVVGKAYRMIGEYERAWLVFKATIDSSFVKDSALSAVLEDQGQFLGSLVYLEDLWREYPDSAQVVSAYFALSQAIFRKAPDAEKLKSQDTRMRNALKGLIAIPEKLKPEKATLLLETVRHLRRFLALYPADPLTDDAAFSMVNAFFEMKDYPRVVEATAAYRERYPKSEFQTSFEYMAALGHFWQRQYEDALGSSIKVADGESKDRDYARYITAQIYHAQRKPSEAIPWYAKVKALYPDAKEAIAYFERKAIAMDEVNSYKPGEKVTLEVRYRNIKQAALQVYKVDLMKLYLREKNLSNITKVNLAGITPETVAEIDLGDGMDYEDKETIIDLPVEDEGAYLVICRGDDLFTSGLVLITPLHLEVQESAAEGMVRANVTDQSKKSYVDSVHVKAIGTRNAKFKSGETDLRGVFQADDIKGVATVIAREGTSRYAFYRGKSELGPPPAAAQPAQAQPSAKPRQLRKSDYLQNLQMGNDSLQKMNINQWDAMRRSGKGAGVEVQMAH